ncbi:hypothetical protein QYF61_021890 [Mycteria americana]|uniref:Peptidase S1 domain-containing protein n=1 Tax=Mycteria americana TaxID=33587 RepID=A0AAN7N829_MYCAM|nr:hypothetical protein QYF61_021890 [Mycteria americana]
MSHHGHVPSRVLPCPQRGATSLTCPLSPRHIQVRAGEHSLAATTGQEQYATAVEVVVHPGFGSVDGDSAYANDLMLLRVEPPFTITPYVQPLALPRSPPATGTNCTVMGWGTTTSPQVSFPDTPQCVNVTVVGDNVCRMIYGRKITEDMLLRRRGRGGQGLLPGTSRSPMSYSHVPTSPHHVPTSPHHDP